MLAVVGASLALLPAGVALPPQPTPSATAGSVAAAWTVAATPLPPDARRGTDDAVTGVDCWSAGQCALAGTYRGGTAVRGVLAVTGQRPSSVVAPLPGDAAGEPQVQLGAVSCWSAGQCVAVGSYRTVAEDVRPLVETLSGGRWRAGAPDLPRSTGPAEAVVLDQVACSPRRCVAVGGYEEFAPELRPLILVRPSGRPDARWRPAALSAPGFPVTVTGVACGPTDRCAAFGSVAARAAVFTGSGASWRARYAPVPDGFDSAGLELTSMSCPTESFCAALGSGRTGRGSGVAVVRLRGEALSTARLPLPAGPAARDVRSGGLSCVSSGTCAAVASTSDGPGGAVVLHSRAGVWSARTVTMPSNAIAGASAFLQDVACVSARSCVAVGGFDRLMFHGRTLQRPLILRWDGTRWTAAALAAPTRPSTAAGDALYQVVCRAGGCLAAGSFVQYDPEGSVRELGGFTAAQR